MFNLVSNICNNWYSNESFLIYNQKIYFSVKKQYFYKEMFINEKKNFLLGFGEYKTDLLKKDIEYELYKYFNYKFDVEVCLDIQKGYIAFI